MAKQDWSPRDPDRLYGFMRDYDRIMGGDLIHWVRERLRDNRPITRRQIDGMARKAARAYWKTQGLPAGVELDEKDWRSYIERLLRIL